MLYTVDSGGFYAEGRRVDVRPVDVTGPEDLVASAREFLPEGVAEFGRLALLTRVGPELEADAYNELLLELTRRDVAPEAPSRLRSLYAFFSLEDALAFRERHRDAGDPVFCVDREPVFRGDARLLGRAEMPLVTALYARWYWQGRPGVAEGPLWETLVEMPVTIGERVA